MGIQLILEWENWETESVTSIDPCEVKKVYTEVVIESEAVLVIDVDAPDLRLGRVRGSTEDLDEILVMQTAVEAPMVVDTTKVDWESLGLSTEDAVEDEISKEALANMMDQSTPSPTTCMLALNIHSAATQSMTENPILPPTNVDVKLQK